jgi:hypothetical protein
MEDFFVVKIPKARVKIVECSKCGGTGYIPQYREFKEGRCFDCNGLGHKAILINEPEYLAIISEIKNYMAEAKKIDLTVSPPRPRAENKFLVLTDANGDWVDTSQIHVKLILYGKGMIVPHTWPLGTTMEHVQETFEGWLERKGVAYYHMHIDKLIKNLSFCKLTEVTIY